MKVREIAHSRAGDKGDTSNVSVIAFDPKDYPLLRDRLTTDVVKTAFGNLVKGKVVRYELPNIGALNFVMHEALGGGVTTTLRLDIHGKSLSSIMVNIDIPGT
jgi:hypothetical protein